uniref:Myosin motor domain-containing protein n=1 Tax=Panagrolaimus sp. PS1159 TaxID=55785 RepID=A0AC35FWW9_9BILA
MAPKPQSSPSKSLIGIDFGKLVYIPHEISGFQLGKLVDIRSDGLAVELLGTQDVVKVNHDEVFPAEDNQRSDVDDNCALMYLNEATLLHNCQIRYNRKQIYTYVANILISINPYEQIPDLYSSKTIKAYMGKSLGTMPPHVFAIADMAYRDMKRLKRSQSVIVSGESGAGKTESQKSILRYLCDCWGASDGKIEQRLLETNPILEAFGNAKTLRNNNSSRFGKFVEIHFNTKFQVAGGHLDTYLLEKSRLCHQSEGERNYHIFYQLLAGADDATVKEWNLGSPDKFRYLAGGCTQFFATSKSKSKIPQSRFSQISSNVLNDDLIDDYFDFHRLRKSLLDTGFSESKRDNVFKVIAGILHLGNIEFEDNVEDSKGGCMILPKSTSSLNYASKLLGVEKSELLNGLITRVMQPAKGGVLGTIIRVPLKPREASNARDALAKAIYNRIFDTVVLSINKSIPFTDSVNYIGVLDIAGFEFFAINSFEQFCINYCNEKLQQFFNDRILKQEQELYAKEGLNVPKIEYADNQDCIELFEEKPTGLLDLLDEEARLPKPSSQHFTDCVHRAQKNHFRLSTPRKSRLREHRDMRDDEGFLIRHYAGTVCYQTAQFLDKNNDALHMSLEILMEMSSNTLISEIFKPSPEAIKAASKSRPTGNKLAFASVSSKFRTQLAALLEKLRITGTHFVRCIKPNSTMEPSKFDGAQILSQLKCAGMASVLKLMQKGFPSRTSFADLYDLYKDLLPPKLKRLDPRLFCKVCY